MKKVLLLGHPDRVQPIKRFVNAKSQHWRVVSGGIAPLRKIPFVDAVVTFGGTPEPSLRMRALFFRRPIGIVWTSREIASIENAYDAAAQIRARRYRHACYSALAKAELHLLGIVAMHIELANLGRLEAFFNDVLDATQSAKHRAVVSGSPQRVAAFVEAASLSMRDWEFHAAISGSRAERLNDAVKLIRADRWYRLADRPEDRLLRVVGRLFRKRRFRPRDLASERRDGVDETQQESVTHGEVRVPT